VEIIHGMTPLGTLLSQIGSSAVGNKGVEMTGCLKSRPIGFFDEGPARATVRPSRFRII
jgi:hypothetical protein